MSDKVISLIRADDIETAYVKAKDLFKVKDKKEAQALNILIALNELISPALKAKSSCKSSPQSVFSLSDLCCACISETWKCTHLRFMRSVYHINRYLLSQGCPMETKRLCEYYFKLRTSQKKRTWEESEKVVVTNTLYDLACFLCKTDGNFCQEMLEHRNSSFFVWWQFLSELVELNDYENLAMHFTVSANFISGTRSLLSASEHMNICNRILLCYKQWFDNLNAKAVILKCNENDLVHLITHLLERLVSSLSDIDVVNYKCDHILNFLDSFCSTLGETSGIWESVTIIKKLFLVCDSLSCGGSTELFNDFKTAIEKYGNKRKSSYCEVIVFSWHLIFKLRSLFVKNSDFVEKILPDLFEMILNSQCFIRASTLSVIKKVTVQVNSLFTLMYFTYTSQNPSKVLSDIYKEMKRVFKAFVSITNITDVNGFLCFGVTGCINVLMSYNKAELYSYSASLSVYLIKYLLKIETSHLITSPMTTFITYAVNAFVQSLGKIGHEETAQLGLLALVGVHKELHETVFTAWANLKANKSNSSFNMESTVYDVIQSNQESLEIDWFPCKVESFQMDDLLLKEIRSYTKHKCLHGDPVLAVYRTAAQVCTNKLVLAEILICATDVITVQPEQTSVNRFEISLANIIQHLNKRQASSVDPVEKLYIFCLLGNIHYQKARCEIMHLRKKSEAEVVRFDVKPKYTVPILQANEGDILNESYVAEDFSYLKLDTQVMVMELLEKALTYWKKSCETLNTMMRNEYYYLSLGYIKATGYLYRLYSYKVKEVETWELLYKLGEKLNSQKHQVLAIAELLSIQFTVRTDWVQHAKDCVQNEVIDKKSYISQLFIVSQAKNAYNNKKIEESKSILDSLDIGQIKLNFLVYVQHQILTSLLSGSRVQSPDKTLLSISSNDCPLPAVKAFVNLLQIVNHSKWNTFSHLCVVHCLLLDTSLFLGKLYGDMKYVRQARCYTKQQVTLAQRLALPIRVTDLLILLARLDILCGNTIDCDIKLKGVESILELEKFSDGLAYRDVRDDGSSSPVFMSPVKLKPKFIHHNSSCSCYHCSNIDYQIQSLQAVTLRADLFVTKGSSSEAKQLFKAGKNLIKMINSKLKPASNNLITTVFEAEIRFYVTAVTALGKWNSLVKAVDYYNLANNRLNEMPMPDPVLYSSFYYLETCIRWMQNYSSPSIKSQRDLTPLGKKVIVSDAVTPTNIVISAPKHTLKRSHLIVPVTPVPMPIRRRLALEDVSNDEDTSPVKELSKPARVPVRRNKVPVIYVNDSPFVKLDSKTDTVKKSGKLNFYEDVQYSDRKNFLKTLAQSERKPQKTKQTDQGTPLNTGFFQPKSSIKIFCDDIDNQVNTVRRGRSRRKLEVFKGNDDNSSDIYSKPDKPFNSNNGITDKIQLGETNDINKAIKTSSKPSLSKAPCDPFDNCFKVSRKLSFDDEDNDDGVLKLDYSYKSNKKSSLPSDSEIKQKTEREIEKLSNEFIADSTPKATASNKNINQETPLNTGCFTPTRSAMKIFTDDIGGDIVSVRKGRLNRKIEPLKMHNDESLGVSWKETNTIDQSPKQATLMTDSDLSIIENTPPEKACESSKKLPLTPSHLLKDFKTLTISNKEKPSNRKKMPAAVSSDSQNVREVRSITRLRTRVVLNK